MCKYVHLEVNSDRAQGEQDTLVSVYSVKMTDILKNGERLEEV
jgi:hypothetical protein